MLRTIFISHVFQFEIMLHSIVDHRMLEAELSWALENRLQQMCCLLLLFSLQMDYYSATV